MAEPNDNLSPEEVQQIEELLNPLNKNPQSSDDLNPMLPLLKEKLGFMPSEEGIPDEEDAESSNDDDGIDLDGPPAYRDIESEDQDDDIDLDELLGAPPKPQAPPAPPTAQFEDYLSEIESSAALPEPAPSDPFQNESEAGDPFQDESEDTNPFLDLENDETKSYDLLGDPFEQAGNSVPWDALEPSETPESAPAEIPDDFGFGEEAPAAEQESGAADEEDPFGGLDAIAEPGETPAPVDDFGFGEEAPASAEDPFADFSSEPSSDSPASDPMALSGSEDPFGDLGDSFSSTPEDTEPSGSFDDIAPSLDDIPVAGLEENSEVGFESDLASLDQESAPPPEPEVDLEEGLSDEDLAVIQRELIKYPPKLRRTLIDTIVNRRVPTHNQKEILELIKAQQKPEDVAAFLSSLLGEPVELVDNSGKFSQEGIPILASKEAYTKEGAIRRRELIRKTFIYSSAAIALLTFGILLFEKVIRPFRADSYYASGLEKIEEFSGVTDATEKQRLLFDAENDFAKGEAILPHSLKQLNAYCMAYMKIGQYEKAFEKCFGKVEPDFGYEPEDKENKRAWHKRTEVPNISLAPKSKWNDAGVKSSGREFFPELSFSLVSQDKVQRRVIKAGAYIASRLKYDIHDPDTYIALGKFHSFHRNDFINIAPGSATKPYKNDNLAIEYFKRVFSDANEPDHVEATAGIAKVFYHKEEFVTAAKYYNDIIEKHPTNSVGHGGLLSTFIEIWKRDKNPQFVLNHHRQVRNALNIEEDLTPAVLSKLAAFYIDLDSQDVRIRYNINPEDQVTGMEIDDNVEYLLNIAYNREGGAHFAEGYYQRARFYLKTNQSTRALKQLELASTYDVRHYLAVLTMAEYYMKTENFNEAVKLLEETENRYSQYKNRYGEREEDETLLEGKPGRISYNLAKIYLTESAGVNADDKIKTFPGRKIYPERSLGVLSEEERERRNGLYAAQNYFKTALERGISDNPGILRDCYYSLGWIDYMHNDFASALDYWSELPDEDGYNNPSVLLGKAHSFFYTNQLNASMGNYLKLKDDYERKADAIGRIEPENSDHREIYETLVAVYNNIGAIFEKRQDTSNALKYYWKAMETARKIISVSEIATSNKDLVFTKSNLDRAPLLEDWLPPTLDRITNFKSGNR